MSYSKPSKSLFDYSIIDNLNEFPWDTRKVSYDFLQMKKELHDNKTGRDELLAISSPCSLYRRYISDNVIGYIE